MATFIIPADGSSVKASEFAKAADEARKRHQESLNDQQRKDAKAELDLLDDAIACAKQLARSFPENVYGVVSSAHQSGAFPVGSGSVVDIRLESRGAVEQPQPAPVEPKPMTRAEARRRQREEGRNVASTIAQGAQVAPAPTPYMPGSRAEEIAAGRPLDAAEHTVVPPSTGSGAYMPGSRAEELAARRPLATGGTVPATQEEADRNARLAEDMTRQAGERAGRSTRTSKRGGKKAKGRKTPARRKPAAAAPPTPVEPVNPAVVPPITEAPRRTRAARPAAARARGTRANAPKSNA